MRVTIVCTGNVARSPALAALLAARRPDLDVTSAAVGLRAKPGRRMARPMRDRLTAAGHADAAEQHRSALLAPDPADVVVAVAPIHSRRLADSGYPGAVLALDPAIPDPAFGGEAAYETVWPMLVGAADYLSTLLPEAPA